MIDIKEIYKSWITSFNPTPEQKQLSEERLNECIKCENNIYLKLFGTFVCNQCNCPINKIIFVENKNKCKLEKWKN